MYAHTAKVFLGEIQWILCISSIFHHFLLLLLCMCMYAMCMYMCMPPLG